MDTAACKNKGYILDGYPRTFGDAKTLFTEKERDPLTDEEATSENPFPGYKIITDMLPQYVIVLTGEDAQLKQRVKDMLPEKSANTHYNDAQMDRRLKIYRDANVAESGITVQDFFGRAIPTTNGGKPASENIRVSNSFLESDYELLHDM